MERALAELDGKLSAIWVQTAQLPETEITTQRLRQLQMALRPGVRVRVVAESSAPASWRTAQPFGNFKGGEVRAVLLQCARGNISMQAREANGVVLGLGASAAEPWRYLAIPPPAVRYITSAEDIPRGAQVFRAEDGTRVTLSRRAGEQCRYTTAGSADASNLAWFGTTTLAEVVAQYLPDADNVLESGWSYTFILHDGAFQPYEQQSAGFWFVSATHLDTLEVSYQLPAGCIARAHMDFPDLERAVQCAQNAICSSGDGGTRRPFYGLTFETSRGPMFAESKLYRELRQALYEADPLDQVAGPECRLKVRGLRAFIQGRDAMSKFEGYFPQLSLQIRADAERLLNAAAREMVRLASASGRAAAASGTDPGAQLGAYLFTSLKSNTTVLARIHKTAPRAQESARAFAQQAAFLDVIARHLFPELPAVIPLL